MGLSRVLPSHGYVYLAECERWDEDAFDYETLYKIGWSANPDSRMEWLAQTWDNNPHVQILNFYVVADCYLPINSVLKLEKYLHGVFCADRVQDLPRADGYTEIFRLTRQWAHVFIEHLFWMDSQGIEQWLAHHDSAKDASADLRVLMEEATRLRKTIDAFYIYARYYAGKMDVDEAAALFDDIVPPVRLGSQFPYFATIGGSE